MKILFAIITCEKNMAKANAQRATWVPNVKGADVKFFLATQQREPLADEIFLEVPDDYHGLPQKVRAMMTWALGHGYDLVLKLDDDVYAFPDRLMGNLPQGHYTGHVNETPPRWNSGFAYWVDKKAMGCIFHAAVPVIDPNNPATWAEDRWVGTVLGENGIEPDCNPDFVVADSTPKHLCIGPGTEVACEFDDKTMHQAHRGPVGWEEREKANREAQRKKYGMAHVRRPMRGDGTPFP